MQVTSADPEVDKMGLTPRLGSIVQGLRSLPDDKMRVKQVLYLASQGAELDEQFKIAENKVQGCLSTVHVSATLQGDGTLQFRGDSDAQITKGLAILLCDGLSGSTAAEVSMVQPDFIKYCGLGASLTPGRNNGFINMLAMMKEKASQLQGGRTDAKQPHPRAADSVDSSPSAAVSAPPPPASNGTDAVYDAILAKARVLKPADVQLVKNDDGSLALTLVAECFSGLSEEKRQKMVATVMRKEIQRVPSLSVVALTPAEAQ